MEPLKYNLDYAIPPFGLENISMLCYFNSMLQALMSCPSFVQMQIYNESALSPDNLGALYIAKWREMKQECQELRDGSSPIGSSYDLFKKMAVVRRSSSSVQHLRSDAMEDMHEGLLLFLDSITKSTNTNPSRRQRGPLISADVVFHMRHTCHLKCRSCKLTRETGDTGAPSSAANPTEIFINVSRRNFRTQAAFEDHIKQHTEFPPDFRCECGVRNTNGAPNIAQVYSLTRLSEVIIVLFDKYHGKYDKYFPPVMQFSSAKGPLRYRIVATIEHSGTMSGGHYTARCLRPKPQGLHIARRQRLQEELLHYRSQIRSGQSLQPHRVAQIEHKIDLDLEQEADPLGVFEISDGDVRYADRGFQPMPNTYLVFYHLY
jgi:hypothetical protein